MLVSILLKRGWGGEFGLRWVGLGGKLGVEGVVWGGVFVVEGLLWATCLDCQQCVKVFNLFFPSLDLFSGDNSNTANRSLGNENALYPQTWRGNLTVYERQNKGVVRNYCLIIDAWYVGRLKGKAVGQK